MLKKTLEKLYLKQKGNLVYYDSMTGCKTRLYYDTVAKKKYSLGNYGVVFVDVDNLKKLNDEKGHDYGDALIKKVANQLLEIKDVLDVCRIGGDEFVCFTNIPIDLTPVDNIEEVSYGFDYKDICQNIETTISNAEKAMYKIKNKKKEIGKARR